MARAAWWGLDEEDATEALQTAILSGAKRVIVPNLGRDWVVKPIRLVPNLELVLEPGVVIPAKRGEYTGKTDSVFTAQDVVHFSLDSYGAVIRMQKLDYVVGKVSIEFGWARWFGHYERADRRMALALRGCENVRIYGVTLRDSGGDGIYVDGSSRQPFSRDVHIRDVICDNNCRQGLSVISADNLTVENSIFRNPWGTPPSAGVDIEPDSPDQRLRSVVFRNCLSEDNYGDGIQVSLGNLRASSGDVSILFESCRVTSRLGSGIRVTRVSDDGPGGTIEFRNCIVETREGYGIKVQGKSASRARVRFIGRTLR